MKTFWTVVTSTTTTTTTILWLSGFCPGLPGWASYQKGKTNLDLLEQEIVSGSGISWAICTSPQTDNHTSTPPLSFLQAGCPSCQPSNSVKVLNSEWTAVNIER